MPTSIDGPAMQQRLTQLRELILQLSLRHHLGHLGGQFSMLEALVAWDRWHGKDDQFLLKLIFLILNLHVIDYIIFAYKIYF